MFRWLRFFSARGNSPAKRVTKTRDPWAGSRGYYVAYLRIKLDSLAQGLSEGGLIVRTRFNIERECAELHTPAGEVLVQIRAHGECGCYPYKAIVTFSRLFPEGSKKPFNNLIPQNVTFVEPDTFLLAS